FQTYLQEQGRSPHTIRNYLSDLRQFAAWFEQTNGEALTPQAVTPTDLREYRQHMLTVQRLSASTINRRLASLAVYLAWGKEKGLIEHNPAVDVRGVRQQSIAPRWLSKRDQGRLERAAERAVTAAHTPAARRRAVRDLALVRLMLNTGLRVGEVCALRMDDVELNERSGSVTVRAGKGDKSRIVPLNLRARRALRRWLEIRPSVDEPSLFVGQGGESLTPSAVRRRIADLARQAGVEATPHTLRHTFGKRLVDSGVSLEKVAALMGHANLNTTRLYVAPSAHDLERAVSVLE
ncbi:recombinase, partial [Candidatus Parcubacteria bacterium]